MSRRRAEKALFWSFVLLLVWAPIPLGSNRPWSTMVLEVWAYALVVAWIVAWAAGKVAVSPTLRAARPAWIVLGAWIVEQAAYVVPLPVGIVSIVSPEAARMHALAGNASLTTLSVDPYASLLSLLETIAYACIFFLALALINTRRRLFTFARVMVWAAFVQSVYAVSMHLGDAQLDYFGMLLKHGDSATGTYVNRNHLAGYLEMNLAIGIGLLIAELSDRTSETWKHFLRNTIDWILSPKMVLRLALCVLVIAMTTTHSRTGNAAFFSSLLVAGAIGIALSRHATRNTVILLASLIAIDLFIVGSWFGVEKLAKRIGQTTAEEVQQREEPTEYALGIVKDYPVLGSGPGSFYVVFPRYRKETVVNFYDHVHNDYVETAAERGIVGFATAAVFVALAIGAALLAQWRRRDPLMRGMSFACIMGGTSILIHSWTDFNLQIPANAALFVIVLSLGWLSLHMERRGDADPARAHIRLEEE